MNRTIVVLTTIGSACVEIEVTPAAVPEAQGVVTVWIRTSQGTPLEETTLYTLTAAEGKAPVAALEQVMPALEELHRWRRVADWIGRIDKAVYERLLAPAPGAGGTVRMAQPGSNGWVTDTAALGAVAAALAERAAAGEDADVAEQPAAGGGARLVTGEALRQLRPPG